MTETLQALLLNAVLQHGQARVAPQLKRLTFSGGESEAAVFAAAHGLAVVRDGVDWVFVAPTFLEASP